MADLEQPASTSAPRKKSLKPTFATQASALMKKNLTYQKRNWKANLCLVLSPVIFSVVLAIIQIVINGLFDDDRFRCGCQCAVYKSPQGDTWTFEQFRVNGTDFWPLSLTGANGTRFRIPSQVTCTQRDYGRCGLKYSEATSVVWCPIDHPVRIPQLVPIPAAKWRADVPGYVAAENQTDTETSPEGDTVSFTAPNIPVSIPYTGANQALAEALMKLVVNAGGSAQIIKNFVETSMSSLATRTLNLTYLDTTSFTYNTPMMQAFGSYGDRSLLNGTTPRGGSNLNLVGGTPLMGTSRRAGAQLQNDGAFSSAGGSAASKPAFSFLMENCNDPASPLNAPVAQEVLSVLRDTRQGSGPPFCDAAGLPARCTPATVRLVMERLGDALALTPFKCVSTSYKWHANVQQINEALFSGYGKGSTSDQAKESAFNESNIQQYPFAVDFLDTTDGSSASAPPRLAMNVWYNNTDTISANFGAIRYRRMPAMMNALANAFLNRLLDPTNPAPRPVARLLYLRDQPKAGTALAVDFSSFLGPLFYTWLSQMLLPVMVGLLVYEKERNLRSMMKMQGLGDASYWSINYGYYFVIHLVFQLLIWLFGAALGISMFLLTQPGVIVLFYILFTNVQIAIAFLFNALFSSSKTATVLTVVYVIISGLLGEFLLKPYIESTDFSRSSILGMMILVPFSLYRGYYEMAAEALVGTYTGGVGLTMAKARSVPQGMGAVYVIFFVEWLILLLAAFYLEQVVASGSGVKKHPLFFLDFFLKRKANAGVAGHADEAGVEYAVPEAPTDEPEDVLREREYAEHKADRLNTPIIAYRLGKTYAGRDGGPPKVACKNFSLSISKGEVFGLLGPNGAGKSTSINMLIGFLKPSSGTAFIEGHDIRQEMEVIYTLLGVCPQHDLLWETLTAREHLLFYGRLKNLSGKDLAKAVDASLQSVNLFANGVGDKQCGGYSGGMKRRLSVAISLIGDPQVIFLDEPSTGLDPASRQQLWGVIKAAKEDRAMVLTTHSMEEAEELCDRLGIFVDGALQCIGNPKELTARYGGFLILSITTAGSKVEEVKRFVTEKIAKGAVCSYAVGGTQTFDLPTDEADLSSVFRQVEAHRKDLGIVDWGVSNMTLEEVFIKISRAIPGGAAQALD